MAKKFGVLADGSDLVEALGDIQRKVYRRKPTAAYAERMAFWAMVELGELANELDIKAERDGTRAGRDWEPSQKAKGELVDVIIFLGNLAWALGMTTDELWDEVNRKVAVNVQRRQGLGPEKKKGARA